MADKPISGLRRAPDIYDDSLLVAEQQGEAVSVSGAQLKKYARQGVADYVEEAKAAAEDAAGSAKEADKAAEDAQKAVGAAEKAAEDAQTAQEGAEKARKAIEDMEVSAATLPAGSSASVEKRLAEGHVKLTFGLPTGQTGARGPAGSSIEKIERTAGTGAAGTVDTYTITLTDGSTHDFQVRNGADGEGAGDMLASVYDPQGKKRDIFAYAEQLAGKLPDGGEAGEVLTKKSPADGDAAWSGFRLLYDPAANTLTVKGAE